LFPNCNEIALIRMVEPESTAVAAGAALALAGAEE
jgi:hypothetical protein